VLTCLPFTCREFGYVLQHEKLHPNLTVWEALMFSALLGLPRTLSYAEKKQRVQTAGLARRSRPANGPEKAHPHVVQVKQVLKDIRLMKVKNSIIGDTEKGLSGGERRRLAIGIELLKDSSASPQITRVFPICLFLSFFLT